MVTAAALPTDTLSDAVVGISAATLTTWRERALLWQRTDLKRALASFTFVADVTTLAEDCSFAGDSQVLVARYDGLPFTAIAFYPGTPPLPRPGTSRYDEVARRIEVLTRSLVAPDEIFFCLVAESDEPLLRTAYRVLEVHPEWQMVFHADHRRLNPSQAVALKPSDALEMKALARREGMQAFEHKPLSRGTWYGVRHRGVLVAQGGPHLVLDQAVEIGNIVTAAPYRRRGFGSQVVAALLRDLKMEGYLVFLHVLKANEGAIAFYRYLGFERQRAMILAQCSV